MLQANRYCSAATRPSRRWANWALLIGKTIFDLYPKEAHEKAAEGIKTILDSGFHKVVKGKMVCKSGQAVDVELMSRALVDQSGKNVGTVTVSRPTDMEFLLKSLPTV